MPQGWRLLKTVRPDPLQTPPSRDLWKDQGGRSRAQGSQELRHLFHGRAGPYPAGYCGCVLITTPVLAGSGLGTSLGLPQRMALAWSSATATCFLSSPAEGLRAGVLGGHPTSLQSPVRFSKTCQKLPPE